MFEHRVWIVVECGWDEEERRDCAVEVRAAFRTLESALPTFVIMSKKRSVEDLIVSVHGNFAADGMWLRDYALTTPMTPGALSQALPPRIADLDTPDGDLWVLTSDPFDGDESWHVHGAFTSLGLAYPALLAAAAEKEGEEIDPAEVEPLGPDQIYCHAGDWIVTLHRVPLHEVAGAARLPKRVAEQVRRGQLRRPAPAGLPCGDRASIWVLADDPADRTGEVFWPKPLRSFTSAERGLPTLTTYGGCTPRELTVTAGGAIRAGALWLREFPVRPAADPALTPAVPSRVSRVLEQPPAPWALTTRERFKDLSGRPGASVGPLDVEGVYADLATAYAALLDRITRLGKGPEAVGAAREGLACVTDDIIVTLDPVALQDGPGSAQLPPHVIDALTTARAAN